MWGYACGLDMTRRDLQAAAKAKGRPWSLAKDFENAAVISPLAPASAIGHPQAGRIHLSVNGQLRQQGDLADMIWSVPEVIANLSQYYRLQPGSPIRYRPSSDKSLQPSASRGILPLRRLKHIAA